MGDKLERGASTMRSSGLGVYLILRMFTLIPHIILFSRYPNLIKGVTISQLNEVWLYDVTYENSYG